MSILSRASETLLYFNCYSLVAFLIWLELSINIELINDDNCYIAIINMVIAWGHFDYLHQLNWSNRYRHIGNDEFNIGKREICRNRSAVFVQVVIKWNKSRLKEHSLKRKITD